MKKSDEFVKIYEVADAAGKEAADSLPKNFFGGCGFAWIKVKPGNSAFAKWLVKEGKARASQSGGVTVWVPGYGQCISHKESYADAFAAVLSQNNIQAYSESRLD
jgi:hypothetical protein